LARLKEERSSREAWDLGQELLKVKDQVSTLERQLQNCRSEASMEEGSLKDLSAWAERKFSTESQRIQGLERELSNAEARLNGLVQELSSEAAKGKLEVESKLNLLRSDLEARVDTQISARFREQPAPGREMESKLRSLRLDLEGKLVTVSEGKIQSLEDRLESRMVKSRVDLEETMESFIGDRLERLRKECHEDAKGYFQDVQVRLSDDLVAMQQRLVSDLRAETTLALNRESAAIAALDEQLWITDQRLGQRIDDLEQVRVRERGSAKNGRVLSSILSETLEETRNMEMEPTTNEAADRRAKRVSKSVLADAQMAARSMMEECRTDDVHDVRDVRDVRGGLLPRRGREVTTSTRRSFEDEGLGRLRSTQLGGGALGMASKAADTFASRVRYD